MDHASAPPPMVQLDLRGLKCPLPALRARKALAKAASGSLLMVEATDPMAAIDIPHMARQEGAALLSSERDGDTLRFVLRKP
ncbi:sulfurtransferase TusA family protein [Alsobacter sp. KACC 23698]|jgi:tRNA 2-thiouridine synthesizing protein A|uniref:Sulfurtransferase TusA family protein n=1 Tax=Alsobacter sp. KACC 23698 TaxID=3149229 RepID=A0AAU7JDT6_9HYPH